jgi:NCS1 family nucleobase:cation symporter-1
MTATQGKAGVFQRLDQLNEFDREPVSEDKLCGGGYFAGSFSGEHVAATEFVIGASFVMWGASTYDVLVGLLVGNLLAVLSWTLICAPIAVNTRLTLYWYLRKIGGPAVMVVYNVLNALLFCVLAGCMITVAASAVRIPFGIEPQTGTVPTDPWFVLVVIVVGAVVVLLAILGFKRLAQFASLCAPWMFLMFICGALVTARQLGQFTSFESFLALADKTIWTGIAPKPENQLGFWHIVSFAWICNLAMHIGLSDMALFRYAKKSWYGLYSSFGMLLGHYLAWICAGIMGAAAAQMLGRLLYDPATGAALDTGEIAFTALGYSGALAVVIAGWTTSNPTLYRAGLALQAVTPGWPRWLVTLLAGVVTTAVACFPFVFLRLLDFVGLYGLLLMPVGAIVVVEHWIFPKIGYTQFWSARKGQSLNAPALVAWIVAVGIALFCTQMGWIHLFFLAIPVWFLTAVLYIVLAAASGARDALPELVEPVRPVTPAHRTILTKRVGGQKTPAYGAGLLAVACLALTLFFAYCTFQNYILHTDFVAHLVWLTAVYFLAAITWANSRGKKVIVEEHEANPADAESDKLIGELKEETPDLEKAVHEVAAEELPEEKSQEEPPE